MSNPFSAADGSYAKVRPAYPEHIVRSLVTMAQDLPIVELGAGTGKLTAQLADAGVTVYAVEPADSMRNQLPSNRYILPCAATAEATGLPDNSTSLVVAAQAWHWFNAQATSAEVARLLQPGGCLAIIFNQMLVEIPWVHRLTRIMRSGDVHRPDKPPIVGAQFTSPELVTIAWEERLHPAEVMELGRTRSSWLKQDDAGKQRMQDNLRWYLYDHLGYSDEDQIAIPYQTLLWVSHLRGESQ